MALVSLDRRPVRPGNAPDGARRDRRLVLVPVGAFDLRTARAVEHAWRVPAADRRAVHVASDEAALEELARTWMAHTPRLPLHVVEDEGGVAATIRRVVQLELASGYDEVLVVIGHLAIARWWHRLLHDRDARAITRALSDVRGAVPTILTVAVV
jgi:hypothetical protein